MALEHGTNGFRRGSVLRTIDGHWRCMSLRLAGKEWLFQRRLPNQLG